MEFRYTGDSTGSSLEHGKQYRICQEPYTAVDMVTVEEVDTHRRKELSRKEWQVYQQLDLIHEVDT